jgi:hypothetical protein
MRPVRAPKSSFGSLASIPAPRRSCRVAESVKLATKEAFRAEFPAFAAGASSLYNEVSVESQLLGVTGMRVTDATDDTFDSLTANGAVVVAFYTSASIGYKAVEPKNETPPAGKHSAEPYPPAPPASPEPRPLAGRLVETTPP